MKFIKHGHACLEIINKQGSRLFVDPGSLTELPEGLNNIEAVVITHDHADHLDVGNLVKILKASPKAVIYGHFDSIAKLAGIDCKKVTVDINNDYTVLGVEMNLFHVDHAVIFESSPCKNLAVLVGDFLFYPGDSFYVTSRKAKYVAVPVSAPWLKTSESIYFAKSAAGEIMFPTHNGLLSKAGHAVTNNWLAKSMPAHKKWLEVKEGDTLS